MLEDYEDRIVVAVGAHNPFYAKMAEKAGFDAIYVSGACTSLERIGFADVGLITATEVIQNARYITSVTNLPVIADADTGYGNAINVMRTVRDFIRAGVASIHIEDQVEPKRCGHLKGKLLISKEEMIGKIKAAKKVIKEEDKAFILTARTDARNAVGGGMDEVIKRLNAYAGAGADFVIADALMSKEEVELVAEKVKAPTGFHPTGISPRLSIDECQEMGLATIVYPLSPFQVAAVAVWDYLHELKEKGTKAQIEFEERVKDHPLGTLLKMFNLANYSEIQEYEEQFLPREETILKYEKSLGI